MSLKERAFILYLEDMLQSIQRIEEYTLGFEFITFKRDYKTVDAVVRNFEIIGEAAKNVPDEIKFAHPEIPWKEMYLLRNKVSHEYFGIDYEVIWDIVKNYLPQNKIEIEIVISKLKS